MGPKQTQTKNCISNFSSYSHVITKDPYDDLSESIQKPSKSTKKRLRRQKKKRAILLAVQTTQIKKLQIAKRKKKRDLKIIMDKLSNM